MRVFIERQLGVTFVLACVLALLLPGGEHIPDYAVVFLLAAVTFLSCYKIRATQQRAILKQSLLFCLFRYAVLPLLGWGAALFLLPEYALAILLLALLPAALSSPAFANLFGGNVLLAFSITLMSSVLALLLIPLYISFFGHMQVGIDPLPLFRTLLLCIVAPACLYFLLRNRLPVQAFSEKHGGFLSVLLAAAIIFIVVAKQRSHIWQQPADLLCPLLIAMGCYAVFAAAGFSIRALKADRVSYGVCATFNNAALGVSLALLHFDQKTVLFTVAAELVWALLPFFIAPLSRRLTR